MTIIQRLAAWLYRPRRFAFLIAPDQSVRSHPSYGRAVEYVLECDRTRWPFMMDRRELVGEMRKPRCDRSFEPRHTLPPMIEHLAEVRKKLAEARRVVADLKRDEFALQNYIATAETWHKPDESGRANDAPQPPPGVDPQSADLVRRRLVHRRYCGVDVPAGCGF